MKKKKQAKIKVDTLDQHRGVAFNVSMRATIPPGQMSGNRGQLFRGPC